MQKLTGHVPETKSPDLVAENIEQLNALFPEANLTAILQQHGLDNVRSL